MSSPVPSARAAAGPVLAAESAAAPGTVQVLAGLRVSLHVGFAVLLAVGLLRAVLGSSAAAGPGADAAAMPGSTAVLLVTLTAVLAGVYLAGTLVERRRWAEGQELSAPAAWCWLFAVLGLWGVLVAHHADFSWVAFPLFFIALHVVARTVAAPVARRMLGVVLVAGLAGVVILALGAEEGLRPAMVVGPLVGAAVALVLSQAYRSLHEESVRQRAVADALRATQDDLARTEHRAGVAAERERLARDIHDTLTQGLASIVLVSRATEDALEAGDVHLAAERVRTVRDTAAHHLAESRAFVRGLRGSAGTALHHAVQDEVDRFAAQQRAAGTPVRAELEVHGEPIALAEAVQTALLRSIQSSLANVAAHARAERARVTLSYLPTELAVDIADDGVGFDPEQPAGAAGSAVSGVGLASVAERLRAVGGQSSIESAPGEGTVVSLRVPVASGGAVPVVTPTIQGAQS
ncbi:MAG: histidine kinase [Micrococcus sp.]|nr:histidine kinase [Micrococcus sp.]